MSAILRSQGTTQSERYLAQLADRTFLDLWSYPNVFIDRRQNGQFKELCDLLVVCGDHVLVFSDKDISWSADVDIDIAWCRWYRKAIAHSVKQLRKALRMIEIFPDRLYIDNGGLQKLPLSLPDVRQRKVHGILVARGAKAASLAFFGEGTGSLMIRPELKGDDHCNSGAQNYSPLTVGDVNPDGPFMHVMDDVGLDLVLQELDTVSDFTRYLERKALFIRSGRLIGAHGEEDLLGYYLQHGDQNGDHDFTNPDNRSWKDDQHVFFGGGFFEALQANSQYIAKKEADKISYLWDALIQAFTKHIRAGTSINPDGHEFRIEDHELAVRYMALEPRFRRRLHSEAIAGAIEKGQDAPSFFRAMIPAAKSPESETGFFFLTFKVPEFVDEIGGYEGYRHARTNLLYAYALNLPRHYRHLKRIIGIATEPIKIEAQGNRSEDIVIFQTDEWNAELESEAETLARELGIMRNVAGSEYKVHSREYPIVAKAKSAKFPSPDEAPGLNRRQRRSLAAKQRKK